MANTHKFLERNRSLGAKVQATDGTPEAIALDTDGIVAEQPRAPLQLGTEDTNEVSGSRARSNSLATGGGQQITATTIARGAGTAGEVPQDGALFRAAGLAETLLAADITGSAQGGSTSTIQLAAGDAANVERGMVMQAQPGGGSAEIRVVTQVDTGTDTLTVYPDWSTAPGTGDSYTIFAQAVYHPVDDGIERITAEMWRHNSVSGEDDRVDRIFDAAANFQFTAPAKGVARWNWTLLGRIDPNSGDAADPGVRPAKPAISAPYQNASVFLGGNIVRPPEFSLDFGGEAVQPDDPTDRFGVGGAFVPDYLTTGRLNPPLSTRAERDAFQQFLDGSTQRLWTNWGPASGRRVSIFLPAIVQMQPEDEQANRFNHEGLPFQASQSDTAFFFAFH